MTDAAVDVAAVASAMASMADAMKPVLEAVAGHRREAVRLGFSAAAAEVMALAYHQHLLWCMRSSAGSGA